MTPARRSALPYPLLSRRALTQPAISSAVSRRRRSVDAAPEEAEATPFRDHE
jgi:hypothetical protein